MSKTAAWIISLVGLAILAWAFWGHGPWGHRGWMRMDHMMHGRTMPGPAIVQVTVPELSAEAKAGAALFNANCATCHGQNAAGQDGVAPPLVHIIYEPSHHADISFIRAAKYGVRAHHWPFGNMPAIKTVTDDEVQKIVVYVRELQRANGIN